MDESGLGRTDLGLFLDLSTIDSSLPDYRRLFLALRQAILSGRIGGGARLPSTRALSATLGIARNTVKSAYELLQAEGYVQGRQGAGCFVTQLPVIGSSNSHTAESHTQIPEPVTPSRVVERSGLLQSAIPALDHFPHRQWQRALHIASTGVGLLAGEQQGDRLLREEIARWLGAQRGMAVGADQVLISSGSQQGIYLIARQLLATGDIVLLERPGFPGTERAMKVAGANVRRFHQQQLEQLDDLPDAKLMVLTPSRNFPLGHTLSADRRLALLNWAYERDVWLVEDDYDSEFAAGAALSAMFSLDTRERVIYAGTFSRTLFPGLRIGYLVLPRSLVSACVEARRVIDGGLSVLPQRALGEFMACGDYSRHLRRMKRLYQQRRLTLEQLLAHSKLRDLPIVDAGGGMHLCLQLPKGCDEQAVIQKLERAGVTLRPLSLYDDSGEPGLVLGFAAHGPDSMARGVDILERVVAPLLPSISV
ncbi:Transcriptional regulator, GntR family domain [Marinobacterium lacunae]|uniref:Transcriptional regulator, GntR family domain n=1 Tax=Marinobacterium lacunae TaxID=1232683 RepID=A0A081G4D5_9GAMM|nr:PLP-dependent aminotransferase family protein [Marinobacterium lacunae]KEA65640.1 Transcriptional regulator, GntR family domain [Marinobacterium lacunae]